MLSINECIGLSGLSEDEVEAIAEHENLPTIVAAELGCQLLGSARGLHRLHCIFLDCIERAANRQQLEKAKRLDRIYTRFRAHHPMPRVL